MNETRELKSFTYYGHSDIGLVRDKNEDRYGYFNTVNGDVFVVCDGIGGIGDGEIAAETTIDSVKSYFSNKWVQDVEKLLLDGIKIFNIQLLKEVKNYKNTTLLGTTIALILIRDSKVYYTHVGDSRIYYKTKNKIFRLTSDHSFVQTLINKGKITDSEARFHDKRNIITKALGISSELEPEPYSGPIKPADEDYILICSDGLTSNVSDLEMSKILEKQISLKKKVKFLIEKADDYGGEDNITVQLLHFYNTGRKTSDYIYSKKKPFLTKRNIRIIGMFSLFILMCFIFYSPVINIIKSNNNKIDNVLFYDSPVSASIRQNKDNERNITIYIKDNSTNNYSMFKKENLNNSNFIKLNTNINSIIYTKAGENIKFLFQMYKFEIEKIMLLNFKNNFSVNPGDKLIIQQSDR